MQITIDPIIKEAAIASYSSVSQKVEDLLRMDMELPETNKMGRVMEKMDDEVTALKAKINEIEKKKQMAVQKKKEEESRMGEM